MNLVALLLLVASPPEAAFAADLSTGVEPAYERATIIFNQGKLEEALALIESKVLSVAPDAVPALELKALILKGLGRDADALKAYAEVIRVGPATNKPKYYFEVGTLLHKQKRFAQARIYLESALEGEFNVGACHYFLGVIDFTDKKFESAESHFVAAVGSNALELRPLAYFYLGMIYYRVGYPIGAIRGMRYARDAAQTWKNAPDKGQQKTAEEIEDTAHRILKSLDTVRWFGNFVFLTRYDSNVSVLPDAVTTPDLTSGKKSVQQIFTGGGGFMTSPARMFQAVVSYRTFFNYNDNADAKDFDFFSNIPSLYVNYKPWLRLTPGMKIEGNYTAENLAGRDNLMELHPYSLTAEIGPYARYEFNPHLIGQVEAFYEPQKYYLDPATGLDRRSGDGYRLRASAEYTSPWKYLSPTPFLSYEHIDTNGDNWRYSQWALGFSNVTRFSPINVMTFGLDMSWADYGDRRPQRHDFTFNTRIAWNHELTRHFSLLTDFNFTRNSSTLDSLFTYSRFYGGMGLAYTF